MFLEFFPETLITASADSPKGVESAKIVSLKVWLLIIIASHYLLFKFTIIKIKFTINIVNIGI